MPKERLQVKTPSGLDVGERRVAVDAVVPKEVFGEVLDSNPVHLRSEDSPRSIFANRWRRKRAALAGSAVRLDSRNALPAKWYLIHKNWLRGLR